jgi:hypothetical protein
LAWANCPTTAFSLSLLPVVLDCLQPITYCPREKLTSPPTACGLIEKVLQAR